MATDILKTHEITLNNKWRIEYLKTDYPKYSIDFRLSFYNGNEIEVDVEGQVKWDGCMDFGEGKEVMIHFCGVEDATIFALIYEHAKPFLAEEYRGDEWQDQKE